MIEAKIVADSLAPSGVRLTTFMVKYPRFFHSELMTHRALSRNASSSRAIPFKKQAEEVLKDPAVPISFQSNQRGMQGGEDIQDQDKAKTIWLKARDYAVECARELDALNVHKGYVNRLIEPFSHISLVLSATDFCNLYALRCHKDAFPEFQVLANKMYLEQKRSSPKKVKAGYWHLPLLTDLDIKECAEACGVDCIGKSEEATNMAIKRSVAKCARTSYNNHDGTLTSIREDLKLFKRLLGQVPIHASPAEHQAEAMEDYHYRSGNFRGWKQYRKTLPNENIDTFEGTES